MTVSVIFVRTIDQSADKPYSTQVIQASVVLEATTLHTPVQEQLTITRLLFFSWCKLRNTVVNSGSPYYLVIFRRFIISIITAMIMMAHQQKKEQCMTAVVGSDCKCLRTKKWPCFVVLSAEQVWDLHLYSSYY